MSGAKLPQASALFHEHWGTGALDGQMRLNLHGYSDLAASATGDFRFLLHGNWGGNWTTSEPATEQAPALLNTAQPVSQAPLSETSLPGSVSPEASLDETPGQPPIHTRTALQSQSARQSPTTWAAAGTIASQTLAFTKGPAKGTIAFDRTLNLDWTASHPASDHALTPSKPQPEETEASAPATLHITGTLAQPVTHSIADAPDPIAMPKRHRNPRNN
jgi:hypothetical protein